MHQGLILFPTNYLRNFLHDLINLWFPIIKFPRENTIIEINQFSYDLIMQKFVRPIPPLKREYSIHMSMLDHGFMENHGLRSPSFNH